MAELAPWLASEEPAATTGQVAPWLAQEPMPGYAEDMAKGAVAGTGQGIIAIPGAPGDIQSIMETGANKFGNPFKFLSEKFQETQLGKFLKEESAKTLKDNPRLANSGDMLGGGDIRLPTSADIQKQVEKVTGPFYEAKTGPGKAVQTGTQILPSLLTGGQTIPGALIKAGAGGVASELAGEGAAAAKHLLPEGAQPWAEPVARAVGAVGGTLTPAGARRVITPMPMTDERLATVNALRATNPEFVKTASTGQLTDSPRFMKAEARSFPDQAEKQGKAFTEATMARGEDTGKKIGQIYDTNSITSAEFPALNQAISQEKRKLAGITGSKAADDALGEIQRDIRLGASNSPQTLSMTGKRYQYMRDRLQGLIEAENNNTVKKALTNSRQALDSAFERSISNPSELADLRRQKQTFETLANRRPTIDQQVTPESVLAAAARSEGNRAVNTGKSPLANWARDANKLMTPHPKPTEGAPAWFDLTASTLGALAHGGGGAAGGHAMGGIPGALVGASIGGAEGGVFSHLLAPSIYKALSSGASKAVSNKPVQALLGNQLWRPGAHSSAPDREMLLRLLMTPEAKGAGPRSE